MNPQPIRSACAIALTTGYVDAEPGSLKAVQLDLDDATRRMPAIGALEEPDAELHHRIWSSTREEPGALRA